MIERCREAGHAEHQRQLLGGLELIDVVEREEVVILAQAGRASAPDQTAAMPEEVHQEVAFVEAVDQALLVDLVVALATCGVHLVGFESVAREGVR